MPRDIHFSGVPNASPLVSPADHYVPLSSMNADARRQAFGLWLGIVYLNRTDSPRYTEGISAEDDPSLILQFNEEYEAGAWRKLNRGLTLEEIVLSAELYCGTPFMCLISIDAPDFPITRITRRLKLSSRGILELAAVHYRRVAGSRRHPWVTLCYDGKTGHCITLFDSDDMGQLFAYHDPWPGRSLLCEENNVAGLKAKSIGSTQIHFGEGTICTDTWELTKDELAHVLVATLVPMPEWLSLSSTVVTDLSPELRDELDESTD